jgi:nickel/cobalt transporter (NicO) family protein
LAVLVVLVLLVAGQAVAQNPLQRRQEERNSTIYTERVPAFLRNWSRSLQGEIASLSRRVISGDWRAAVPALLLAVLFGVVHIAGPGHGKVFAISYFSARTARLRDGLLYSGVVNIIDTLSALVLVALGYLVLRSLLPAFRTEGPRLLQLISYGLIVAFGVVHLVSHLRHHAHEHHDKTASTQSAAQEQVRRRPPWLLAVSVGLVPCPVSTVLLVYGVVNDILAFSVLLVAAVSLGGFLTMSVIAGAVIMGRAQLLERLHTDAGHRVSMVLEVVASVAIVGVGALLFVGSV